MIGAQKQNYLICDQMNIHFIFLRANSNSIDQIEKLLQNKFLDWRSGIGCKLMSCLMAYSNLIDQVEKLLQKKFLDWRSEAGCDKMT